MSPSPAIPHINESKMKLYEMFAQKQMAPPPNLTHPAVSTTNATTTATTTNLFNFHSTFQTSDVFTIKVEQMLIELDRLLKQSGNLPYSLLPPHHDIILVMRQIPLLINQSAQPTLLCSIVEKVVFQLYQSTSGLAIEVYCRFLTTLLELSPVIKKETIQWFVYSRDERKYNVWIMTWLIKFGLIPLEEYDIELSSLILKANNELIVEFAIELLQNCLLNMHPTTTMEDHVLVIHALKTLESDKVQELMQDLNNRGSFEFQLLFAEWSRICKKVSTESEQLGFAKRILDQVAVNEDGLCLFFRLCTEHCIDHYQPTKPQSIDVYTKLIGYFIQLSNTNQSKLTLLSHVLSIAVLVLSHQHESLHLNFNQKPYLKLFTSLFIELKQATCQHTWLHTSFITVYSDILYTLQPSYYPGFAFSWLQLFSHRLYLPLILSQHPHTICIKLLSVHLSFLKSLFQHHPKSQRLVLGNSEKAFYQGTLRFLVLMLHDYPEFLCEHYLAFIKLLPADCVQLRNVVLSSFPRDMILPDPFTTTLGYMANASEPTLLYQGDELHALDTYLDKTTTLLDNQLLCSLTTTDNNYDEEKIQSLVFYAGTKSKLDTTRSLSEHPAIQIYKHLLNEMTESRDYYLLMNAIVDHLRYPNSHTYFFSMALMHLFSTQSELIKELITRVLLERLIVNRPHPWGLLTTFIQLIKEPHFSQHEFIKHAISQSPDIKRLFENVLKSTQQMSISQQ